MKVIFAAVLCTASVLAGCASPSVPRNANADFDEGIDAQKVAMINRAARDQGLSIYWVHYPQRKPAAVAPADVMPSAAPAGT